MNRRRMRSIAIVLALYSSIALASTDQYHCQNETSSLTLVVIKDWAGSLSIHFKDWNDRPFHSLRPRDARIYFSTDLGENSGLVPGHPVRGVSSPDLGIEPMQCQTL